jgi:uncharacterized membrane protein
LPFVQAGKVETCVVLVMREAWVHNTLTIVNTFGVRLMIFSLITVYCLPFVQAGKVETCVVLVMREAWVRNTLTIVNTFGVRLMIFSLITVYLPFVQAGKVETCVVLVMRERPGFVTHVSEHVWCSVNDIFTDYCILFAICTGW